jgi:hypothetical protein
MAVLGLLGRLERGEVHLSISAAGATRFEGQFLYQIHVVAALPPAHRWPADPCSRSPT